MVDFPESGKTAKESHKGQEGHCEHEQCYVSECRHDVETVWRLTTVCVSSFLLIHNVSEDIPII